MILGLDKILSHLQGGVQIPLKIFQLLQQGSSKGQLIV
jgi:hypothetical protein